MTVQELQHELSKYDPNLPVYIADPEKWGSPEPVGTVQFETYAFWSDPKHPTPMVVLDM